MIGTKFETEAADCVFTHDGRRALCEARSCSEKNGGLHTGDHAGMSSEKQVRILFTESPRFPGEGSSSQG